MQYGYCTVRDKYQKYANIP